jgi:predicted methyltransferase
MEKYNIPEPNSLDSMEGIIIETNKQENEEKENLVVSLEEIIPGIIFGDLEKNKEGYYVSSNIPNNVKVFDNASSSTEDLQIITNENRRKRGMETKSINEEETRLIFNLLSDKPLIDLGAGIQTDVLDLSMQGNSSGYVGVEPNNYKKLNELLNSGKDEKSIPSAVVAEDMLAFLRRLPDSSVNITAFSIDQFVLSPRRVGKDYLVNLYKEIHRVLHPEGALFVNDMSDISPAGLKRRDIYEGEYKFLTIFTK